jgi:hypothetical protein
MIFARDKEAEMNETEANFATLVCAPDVALVLLDYRQQLTQFQIEVFLLTKRRETSSKFANKKLNAFSVHRNSGKGIFQNNV